MKISCVFKGFYLVCFLLHRDNLLNFERGASPECRGEDSRLSSLDMNHHSNNISTRQIL